MKKICYIYIVVNTKIKKIVDNINMIVLGQELILYNDDTSSAKFNSYQDFIQSPYFCDILNLHNIVKTFTTDYAESHINSDNVIGIDVNVNKLQIGYFFRHCIIFKNNSKYFFISSTKKVIEIEKYIRNKKLKELLNGI